MAKKKKPRENKQLLEIGQKKRAGRLLSAYLRAISQEYTEVADIATGPDKVEHRIISKAEALARDMFKQAMECADAKLKLEYRKLVLDRIDGRPSTEDVEEEKKKAGIPERISEINKNRANRIASEIVGSEAETKV